MTIQRWVQIAIAFAMILGVVSIPVATADVPAREMNIDLNGDWYFALDPMHRGEALGWHQSPEDWDSAKPLTPHGWDTVTVPHCWSTDPRYSDIQRVWYRRAFDAPNREVPTVYRLRFGAVFYACRVWINGALAGSHEGGYLPFDIDISQYVKPGAENLIAVEVDNSWSGQTLPGARPGEAPNLQLYPWWNWGGLLHGAQIALHDPVYVANQKIMSTIQSNGEAAIDITAFVVNASDTSRDVRIQATVTNASESGTFASSNERQSLTIAPDATQTIMLRVTIPADKLELWRIDHPHLYQSTVNTFRASDDSVPLTHHTSTFGVRSLDVRDAQFLLNGVAVKLAGANRVLDDPHFGGLEPDEVVERDMGMMKRAHLEFARLQHYPCSPAVLDWADRNGFLIIAEAASWGFPIEHLDDPIVREEFKKQMRAMIEQQWNHPCIVGWSVGNEYQSWTPAGVRWTKDMKAFVRSIDDSRPVVFVGLGGVMKQDHLPREERSLHYSDILCINCYMNEQQTAELLDRVHAVWPDRPILISEYGKRSDRVDNEQQRVDHFHNVLDVVRARPYICGLSYWTFNDYRSRYPATNPSGYRPWGVVTPEREPRALYDAMLTALSPATLTAERAGDTLNVRINVRSDFPAYALEGYTLRVRSANGDDAGESALPRLDIGAEAKIAITLRDIAGNTPLVLELVRPTGFVATRIEVGRK